MPFQETPEHSVCGQNSKYYKHVAKFYSSCKFGWEMVFFVAFHNISCTVMTCHCTNQTRSPKRKAVGAKGKGRLSATFVPYRKKVMTQCDTGEGNDTKSWLVNMIFG